MQEPIENADCPLSGTKYCRLLNMRGCAQCAVRGRNDLEAVKRDLDVYESLLPQGGIARLFQTHACVFCKGEPGARRGYAILHMAHPEPRRIQKRKLPGSKADFGVMVPLQMAVCARCRRRFLAMEFLPAALPLLTGGAALVALMQKGVSDALALRAPYLGFVLFCGAVLLGWAAGRLATHAVKAAASRDMFADVLTHPVVREMTRLGWIPVARTSRTHLMLSKSRFSKGLGTAEDELLAE